MSAATVLACLLVTACGGGSGGPDAIATATETTALEPATREEASALAPTEWVQCARESQRCEFTGTRQVRYGTATTTVSGSFSNGVDCSNRVFGDPAVAQAKWCWYAVEPAVAEPIAAALTSPNWILCASEGETCVLPGTRAVRYGTTTAYLTRSFATQVDCSNAVFGDPAIGIRKSCWYADVAGSGQPPASTGDTAWTSCASEGGTCTFSGLRNVRYGTGTQQVVKPFTGSVACNNSVFGDPAVGLAKTCAYGPVLAATPAEPAPPPPAPPAPTTSPTGWTRCASESQTCTFTGTRPVRYGTSTQYVTRSFTREVACSNAVFGDPAVAQTKSCAYGPEETTAGAGTGNGGSTGTGTGGGTPTPTPTPPPALVGGGSATGSNPPVIFNASLSARPGDIVNLQGERFGSAPQVFLDGAGTAPLSIVNKVASNSLSVLIPPTATGALVVRVSNGTGTSRPVALNAAVPYHLDTLTLAPGGAFRVFGRNLRHLNLVPRVQIDGQDATVDVAASDEHMLVATAPRGLAATARANILVDNGNGTGAARLDRPVAIVTAGSGDPLALGVGWGAAFAEVSGRILNAASDPRLGNRVVCDGAQDVSSALQGAIDLAASSGGGVVLLPSGTCRLARGVTLRSRVVLEGAGKSATVLRYESNYPISAARIDLAGLRRLGLANAGPASEGMSFKDSTRVFLQDLRIDVGSSRQMFLTGNRDFVVSRCDFIQRGSIAQHGPYVLHDAAGMVFSENTTSWVNGASSFERVHDSLVRGNRFTRDGAFQNEEGIVHSVAMDFAHRTAFVGNTFDVANGPIWNKTRNDGETLLTEGGANRRTESLGSVVRATADTLYDGGNVIKADAFDTGAIPENFGVAIVHGTGAGQTRRVLRYEGQTMTVDRPWDVIPDASSRYATFVWGLEKSLIKNNRLAQNPRGIWLYHTAVREVDIVGNDISEGGGIYLRSYQDLARKLFMPIYNVRIAQNRVSNTQGQWNSYINAVFVNADARAFGIANLGLEIRDNHIVASTPNKSSNYEEYAGVDGYMGMMRVENYAIYEPMALPRQMGTIFQRNRCTNCDAAVRIGTGAGGTVLAETELANSRTLMLDWATTRTSAKATDTVVRP